MAQNNSQEAKQYIAAARSRVSAIESQLATAQDVAEVEALQRDLDQLKAETKAEYERLFAR